MRFFLFFPFPSLRAHVRKKRSLPIHLLPRNANLNNHRYTFQCNLLLQRPNGGLGRHANSPPFCLFPSSLVSDDKAAVSCRHLVPLPQLGLTEHHYHHVASLIPHSKKEGRDKRPQSESVVLFMPGTLIAPSPLPPYPTIRVALCTLSALRHLGLPFCMEAFYFSPAYPLASWGR